MDKYGSECQSETEQKQHRQHTAQDYQNSVRKKSQNLRINNKWKSLPDCSHGEEDQFQEKQKNAISSKDFSN